MNAVIKALQAATPTPPPDFDPTSVTPTWVGFAITFLVAAAAVLLIMDMVRRVRRVRYRGEIREQLEAERLAADAAPDAGDATPRAGD
jgi:hypothetical protein